MRKMRGTPHTHTHTPIYTLIHTHTRPHTQPPTHARAGPGAGGFRTGVLSNAGWRDRLGNANHAHLQRSLDQDLNRQKTKTCRGEGEEVRNQCRVQWPSRQTSTPESKTPLPRRLVHTIIIARTPSLPPNPNQPTSPPPPIAHRRRHRRTWAGVTPWASAAALTMSESSGLLLSGSSGLKLPSGE